MKLIWETKDVRGGRKVCLPGPGTEQWLIAYHPSTDKIIRNGYSLVSLRDGLIMSLPDDAAAIVTMLNQHAYVPTEWNE